MTSNFSIFDLFRVEVEQQANNLNNGLLALETQPESTQILESLMRACHSIKGAAHISDIDAGVNLAQVMEDTFATAQKQKINLNRDRIEVLLAGVNLLLSMSQQEEADLESWLSEQEEEIEAIQNSIVSVLTPGAVSPGKKKTAKAGKTQSKETRQPESNQSDRVASSRKDGKKTEQKSKPETIAITAAPVEVINDEPEPEEVPEVEVAAESAPEFPVTSTATEVSMDGASMLDLFRLEVEAQAVILNDGLLALESQPQSAKVLESLMRAAHSVKGAARIVAIDAAVHLAHVMEDCFVAAQNQKITLGADDVDILLHGVDLLSSISKLEPNELKIWLSQNNEEIQTTKQQISAILDPSAAPAPTKAKTAPEAKPAEKEIAPVESSIVSSASEAKPAIVKQTTTLTKGESNKLDAAKEQAANAAANSDRVVRVSAENLNRIMGLAGESLIEANWLQPFADSLSVLKKRQLELSKMLEELQESLSLTQNNQKSQSSLDSARQKERECREMLNERINELELYVRRTGNLSDRLYREVIASHMRPFDDGVQGFPRMIRDLARKLGKQVKLEILGKATPVDRDILKKLEAPLTHILRNSVDHGLEIPEERLAAGKPPEGTVRLEALHRGGMLSITISDDGKGIDLERLRQKVITKSLATPEVAAQLTDSELIEFLFLPGFSTAKQVTEISGRGVGLDIARSMAQEVGGTVRASSQFGKGTSFHFQLPLTLSVVRTLLVEISGEPYAFPLARIEQIVMVNKDDIYSMENRQYFTMDNKNIGLVPAYQVLELKESLPKFEAYPVVVISEQSDYYGLVVDRFLGEHDLVVRPLDPRLGKVQDLSAAALMGDGTPILIVDVSDLVHSVDNLLNQGNLRRLANDGQATVEDRRKKILVVDDSITVREMERKLLQNKGYLVDVAVNGLEGWYTVSSNDYDLVVSDIDMPRMNGFELVSKIKNHPKLRSVPVIIVSYKDREEDRMQGLEAGADYYLTKASFHDNTFLKAVVDLIGE